MFGTCQDMGSSMKLVRAVLTGLAVGALGLPAGGLSAQQPIGILLAAGDIAKCNPASGKDEATAELLDTAIAEAGVVPVRILALGDLAYDDGTEQQFKCFDASWGSKGKKQLILPVPGNHDYHTNDAAPYFSSFKDVLAELYKPDLRSPATIRCAFRTRPLDRGN
jgi:hypothetical protein